MDSSADPKGDGVWTPPLEKSQVIWVSIGNRQLDPLENVGSPPEPCKMIVFFDINSDSFTVLGLWVLVLAFSHINEPNCKLMSPEY